MIKPDKKDWTFRELQCHAKGVLDGIGIGIILSIGVGSLFYIMWRVMEL